ncbi:ATP-binding protein [Halopseudomonas sp.]|uniref:ATP-binding protein n=1 Tax=Halopseudomonas sp. TaxID=2901191 RepID=UPI003002866B
MSRCRARCADHRRAGLPADEAPSPLRPVPVDHNLYEHRSVIQTHNNDFTSWGEFFHGDNVAAPIIDRVTHHSHIFIPKGESSRLKQTTGG